MIGTNFTGSCKSNYHTITTTTYSVYLSSHDWNLGMYIHYFCLIKSLTAFILQKKNKKNLDCQWLEKSERAINNGQCRNTDNIRHKRHRTRTNKSQKTQDEDKQITKDTGRGQTNHKRHRTKTNKSQKHTQVTTMISNDIFLGHFCVYWFEVRGGYWLRWYWWNRWPSPFFLIMINRTIFYYFISIKYYCGT